MIIVFINCIWYLMPSRNYFSKNDRCSFGENIIFSFRVILKSSLMNFYFLQSHIKSVDSGETNIDGAIGE